MSGDDLIIPAHPDPVVMCERVNLEMARRFPMVWSLFVNGRIPATTAPEPGAPKAAADRLLSAEEAAAKLGFKKGWMREQVRNGTAPVPVVRMGRRFLFSEAALEAWLKRKGGR